MTGDGHARAGTPGSKNVVPPGVWVDDTDEDDPVLRNADGTLVDTWRQDYPYPERLSREQYDHEKRQLQVELLKLQYWIQDTGQPDRSGLRGPRCRRQGEHHQALHGAPESRNARVVALDIPTERERGQWYFQRYVAHLPTAGEIVMFDRSWYNRAGVEKVMGFCTDEQYETFFRRGEPLRAAAGGGRHRADEILVLRHARRAAHPVRHPPDRPRAAVEAQPHRHRAAEQVGCLHLGQGHDVRAHQHGRGAMDRHQEQRQEARPAGGHAQPAQRDRLRPQGPGRRRAARSADRRHSRGHAGNGSWPAVPHAARQDPAGTAARSSGRPCRGRDRLPAGDPAPGR